MLRRAQHQAMLRERWECSARHHLGLLGRQLRAQGAAIPAQHTGPTDPRHFCAPCQLVFNTYQAWSVHAFKTHGHTAEYRQVQHGLQCQACLRHFTTHVKLCRHLQYQPRCRQTLLSQGHHCKVEPGKGNKRAADEGKYQTPSLQAQGPTLPEPLPQWTPYLERPSIEVVQCLSLIDYDSDGRQLGEDVVRERARLAFSAVCLPIPKILATVKAWKQHIDRHFVEEPSCNRTYTSVADWILSCDLFDWLVPTPSARCTQLNTFKDANSILQSLDLKGIVPTARPLCDDPTLIRVGPSDWIREFLKCTVSAVDEECLETFASGRTPSFIEDPPDDVIFIISVHQLPGWHALPSLPSKDRVFSAALAKATLSGDLLRFALRLWILGVPTTLIASDTEDVIPRKLQELPFLDLLPCEHGMCVRSSDFSWESSLFHLS